ncbi:helix-turn-helix transcriptional regulator [Sphingomonas changnyeongensis]|nr:WYL domain-containing protein [Sphingomonas changnyeongensis]
MAKLDRLLSLVYLLSETSDGVTLDDMATALGVNRRTAERMRDVIGLHFDLEEQSDGSRKRFRILGSLRRVYTRPTPEELAALQTEVDARQLEHSPRAALLLSLLAKIKSALDDRERRRLAPDLELLARAHRMMVAAGPTAASDPATLTTVQHAILAGTCVEFDYVREEDEPPQWRRVIPYGVAFGPLTYLVGKMPPREGKPDKEPVLFRFDRMSDVRPSNTLGTAPEDFDLEAWLAESFGIWRDEKHEVCLRVLPHASARAKAWRFHGSQTTEPLPDGGMRIRFAAGGLREMAEHLFSWAGDLVIESPEELKETMSERLRLAAAMVVRDE